MMATSDILIVGGGPVGATLALALHQQGVPATLLEARPAGAAHQDQRALALSFGSRLILERLGLWSGLEDQATAIHTIHVSQKGGLGRTQLRARDHGQSALGYVLAYGALSAVLDQALATAGVQVFHALAADAIVPATDRASVDCGQQRLEGKLVVLADGGRSLGEIPGIQRETREYGHDALVSKVRCELPHDNIAYERFTAAGPMALLPNGNRDFSLVWTGTRAEVERLLLLPDDNFLAELHTQFGDRVGRFLEIGKRLSFPLRLSYLQPVTAPHLVVIGNAAQTMHPVAGQGFNVGLRDAWELAQQIASTAPDELGAAAMLEKYAQNRKTDTRGGILFTDFLVKTFSNDILGVAGLRGLGLGLLDIAQPLKNRLVGKMSFGARR